MLSSCNAHANLTARIFPICGCGQLQGSASMSKLPVAGCWVSIFYLQKRSRTARIFASCPKKSFSQSDVYYISNAESVSLRMLRGRDERDDTDNDRIAIKVQIAA